MYYKVKDNSYLQYILIASLTYKLIEKLYYENDANNSNCIICTTKY